MLLAIPGVSVQGGVLTILGDQQSVGQNDVVSLVEGPLNSIKVTLNGVSEFLPQGGLNPINQIFVNGLGGSNSLTIDSSNGAITAPILYQGSTSTNSLFVTGGTATADLYTAAATTGAGSAALTFSSGTESIQFQNLGTAVSDSVAGPITVFGTLGPDAINYTEGSSAAVGLVSVNTGGLVAFTNKSTLLLNGSQGADTIDVNDPFTPTGLGSITVNGGFSGTGDVLIDHNVPLIPDALIVTPTGGGAGIIDDLGLAFSTALTPEVTFSNISAITAKGQSGEGDQIQYNGTLGDDTIDVTPGASTDSGTIVGSGGVGTPFSFVPVTYLGYSGTTSGVFAGSGFGVGPVGGTDSVIVDGTAANDTFTVEKNPTLFSPLPLVQVTTGAGAQTPIFFDPSGGVAGITLRGLGGSDTYNTNFSLINAFPGVGIDIEGSATDTLNYTSTSFATTNVDLDTATITSTLANPVTVHGVGTVNINDLLGSASVTGTGGAPALTYIPTGANSASVLIPSVNDLINFSNVFLGFTLNPGLGTLNLAGSVGDDLFYLAGVTDTTATATIDGLLTATIDTGPTLNVAIQGGTGNDTLVVDSTTEAFTSPITFASGGGTDQAVLLGGTAETESYLAINASSQAILNFADGSTETVTVTGLYGLLDAVTVPAGVAGSLPTTAVIGTGSDDTINYLPGIAPPATLVLPPADTPLSTSNADYGIVTVNGGVPFDFTNKGSLGIVGGAGNDTITLNNPTEPATLTGIGVEGGDVSLSPPGFLPSGIDHLVINAFGNTGLVTTPGLIAIVGQLPVVYSDIAAIQILNAAVPTITTVPGVTFVGHAGVPITDAIVAAFIQGPLGYPQAPASSYTVSINWGDGITTPGTIVASPTGGFAVVGSHTYALAGTYSVTVSVKDNGSNPTLTVGGVPISIQQPGSPTPTVLTPTPAVIGQSPLFVVGQPIAGITGVPIPAGTVVATFTDSGGAKPLAAYAATITYTIGGVTSTVPATIAFAPGSTSNYLVELPAAVTIPQVGVYGLQIGVALLTSTPFQTAGADTTITINPAQYPLLVVGQPIVATTGVPIPAGTVVATFTDTGGAKPIADYAATITYTIGGVTTTVPATIALAPGSISNFLVETPAAITIPQVGVYGLQIGVAELLSTPPQTAGVDTTVTVNPAQYPLIVVGQSLTGTTGVAIPAGTVVATFTDTGGAKPIADYAATITYTIGGVTTTVPATIALAPGSISNFLVELPAAITIPQVGVYGLTIGVAELLTTPPQTAGADSTITISPGQYPLLVVGQPVTGTAGVPIPAGTPVATFTDTGGAKPLADYAATITYTIGGVTTTVPATIVLAPGSTSNFIVETPAAITIPQVGTFSFTIGVAELLSTPPQTAGAISTVTINPVPVIDYPIVATSAGTITAHEDLPLTIGTVLASFTYSNPLGTAGDFSGVISWGDGTTSTFTEADITTYGAAMAGQVDVLAVSSTLNHTYAIPGNYQIGIIIDNVGGSAAGVTDSVTVLDAPLFATPIGGATKMGVGFIGPVATFLDTAPNGVVGDYIATIAWGDGVTTLGAVAAGPAGGFVVTGAHTFTKPGSYAALVTITDKFGASTQVVSTIVVAPAVLTSGAITGNVVTASKAFTGNFGAFTSTDPIATPAQFAVTIFWGDGTSGAGVVTEDASKVFHVSGTHSYGNPSPTAVLPVTFSVIDTTSPAVAALVAHGANVVVADAPLSTFIGSTITSLQGLSTGLDVLGTFTSSNPNAKASDFGAIIAWNDGTTTGGTVVAIGSSPSGQTFSVEGTHTYLATGVHPITIVVVHAGGSSLVGSTQDIVSAAPLTSAGVPVTASGGVVFSGTVATFTDANPTTYSPYAYSATIDWGDGSPVSTGTIVGDLATGFSVVGTHVYSNLFGTGGLSPYKITTLITDVGGASTVAFSTAAVSYVATPLTGILDPSSDSGVSSTDAITNVTRPTFIGTSAPGSTVVIFAQSGSQASPVPIATAVTDSTGAYSATPTAALADGSYVITATATDSLGNTLSTATILPSSHPLVIDTTPPVVTSVYFNRLVGQVDVTLKDGGSGLYQPSVLNAANYSLVKKDLPVTTFLPTSITGSTPSSDGSEPVVLTFNGGSMIRGGMFTFTILSGASGVEDIAGNELSGTFYGTFPSGNGQPGSFVATLDAIHHKIFAPTSTVGSSTPVVTPAPTTITSSSVSASSVSSPKTVQALALQSTILGTTGDMSTYDAALDQVSAKKAAKAVRNA